MQLSELGPLVGQEIAVSDWVEVTQDRINLFADATGDHQFIHVDEAGAARGPFGTTVAHGFLTLSMLAGEFRNLGGALPLPGVRVLLNYGLNRVRFPRPVPVGSRLRSHSVLQAIEEGEGYMQFTVLNTVEMEGSDKPACIAEGVFRAYL